MSQDAKVISFIGVITAVIIAASLFFLSKDTTNSTGSSPVDPTLLVRDNSFKIASDSAKVTLVEFSDFQCPACAQTHPTVQKIINDYKGRVNFVYRHFPLTQHKKAMDAALAAEAAGAQGKFWEMSDKLFTNQTAWENNDKFQDVFLGFAKDLGLDTAKFTVELSNPKLREKIQRDYQDGIALGVDATPTFYINNVKMIDAPTYENFKKLLDAALAK